MPEVVSRLAPAGIGKSIVIPVVPAGIAEVISNAMLAWQVPAPCESSVASEQNKMLSIVTPSDVLDCEDCTGDPSLPYADRVFVGTPFADAVKAIAKSAAPPPITFKILMWPPRFRQECLELPQHFHVQPKK